MPLAQPRTSSAPRQAGIYSSRRKSTKSSGVMATTSAGGNRDSLRRHFAEKAEQAKRFQLYKHGRKSRGLRREETETLMRYRAEGATNAELADIFGYQSPSSICMIAKQERERNESLKTLGSVQRSASAPRAAIQTRKQLPSRKLELVRAQDDSSFGFKVEERGKGVFVVTGVRIRGSAARAGLSVGDQVAKFKVISEAEVGWKPSVEPYEAWSSDTLNQVEVNSQVQAIRIARVLPKKHPEGTRAKLARTRRSASCTRSTNLHKYLSKQKISNQGSKTTPNSTHLGKRGRGRSECEEDEGAESTGEASGSASSDGSLWSAVDASASNRLSTSTASAKSLAGTTAAQRTGVSFRPGPNKRVVYCVRLDGEDTLGFSVDQPMGERFRVSHVENRRAAARAGIAAGHWVVSYNLNPIKRSKYSKSARVFEPWMESSLEQVNAHPANHVVAIRVVATNGFSRECIDRMDHIQHAKKSIVSARTRVAHDVRLNQTVIQYDQWLLAGGRADGPVRDPTAQGSDAQATTEKLASRDGTASKSCSSSTKHSSAVSTSVLPGKGANGGSKAPRRTTALKLPAKCLKSDPPSFSSRVGCTVELVQAGMPFSKSHRAFLTPPLLQSIQKHDLPSDVVSFFLLKMAQFIPYRRLRVLPPTFYHSAVLHSKCFEWKQFIHPDSPIVCLPVFESGRWVLVVVASTEKRVIAHYLDCQNPDGFMLPVSSRIMQFIDAAYDELATEAHKPLVVSKPIQTPPATQPSDSGVFVVSYFAAIVRALVEHGMERSDLDQAITNASFDRIFTRERLEHEAKRTWTDCIKPRLCWGTMVPDKCRPYVRLNLRKSTIEPTVGPADADMPDNVAIVDLLEQEPEVLWLSETKLLAFDTIKQSELVSKLGLAHEEAEKLASFYD